MGDIYLSGASDNVRYLAESDRVSKDVIDKVKTNATYFSKRAFEPIKQFISDGNLISVEYSNQYIYRSEDFDCKDSK